MLLKRVLILTVLLLSGPPSCGPQLNITAAPKLLTAREIALAEDLHSAVNAYRLAHGARELALNATLNRYAALHSQYMRTNPGKFNISGPDISHDGFEQRFFLLTQSRVVGSLGENVARASPRNTDMASHLVKLWAGSPRHQQNLLQDWSVTGIGIALTGDGTVYATQLLGTAPRSDHRDLPERIRYHY